MKRSLPKLYLVIAVLSIGCLMMIINNNKPTHDSLNNNNSNTITDNIKLHATGVFQIQYDAAGNKKLEVKANEYTQLKSTKQIFEQPQFYLYQTPNRLNTNQDQINTLNWEIRSDYGHIERPNILELKNNVHGQKVDANNFSFKTDWLNYHLDHQTADSNADIHFQQSNNTGSATGFNMSLISNKIDIQLHNNVIFNFLGGSK